MSHVFNPVNLPEKPDFPAEEEKLVEWWKAIKAFEKCLEDSKDRPLYNFYDGPPFATGLPHYGHILAGTIKDIVCRYAHQTGFHVPRRFGWDCHGLPVEYEIDKKLNVNGREDVERMGIAKYNDECRSIVQRYTAEWEIVTNRIGRWIDFRNDFRTMDRGPMETVWWVFKTLFDKGMVYRAFRVMPFSTSCKTTLSNFEVSQNYKEVSDPSIIVKFKCKDSPFWILAWTTTPWTLVSNLALCAHPALKYLKVRNKKSGEQWICGKARFEWICAAIKLSPTKDVEILEEVDGKALENMAYEPLFPFLNGKAHRKAWKVLNDEYVTTEAGTCVVHQAPTHGEDDYRVCQRYGLIEQDGTYLPNLVNDDGRYVEGMGDLTGMYVKEADKPIIAKLKANGNLVFSGSEVHNYPHCWRSDTPLIYKAISSWFIRVDEIRERLVENNKQTYWVPAHVKEKRFHNWLMEARDWCMSRSRYWGTPLPVWVSDDYEEVVCIGSVKELEDVVGHPIPDIHRQFIDHIEIPSRKGKGMLKRVPEVFDCWFESGSVPYGVQHYPFENKDKFEKCFPAEFIAEGLDQTRGWFYTLMVLSTHLFDKPPFKNLICNGLVLAADGKKMSKRLKNYPDPVEVMGRHGADAVRLYMVNSPVVRAEPLKFKEEGVRNVVREVFIPTYSAYRFLLQEAFRFEKAEGKMFAPSPELIAKSKNKMDRWILAAVHELIAYVRAEMALYKLYTVVPKLVDFLNQLTNWYVRLNRKRMKGEQGAEEARTSLSTLYFVLLDVIVLLAPYTPFITEFIYRNLSRALSEGHPKKRESVHFVMVPEEDKSLRDESIVRAVRGMQKVVEMGRYLREKRKTNNKLPLRSMEVACVSAEQQADIELLRGYVMEEVNVMELKIVVGGDKVQMGVIPNFKVLGQKVGKDMPKVRTAIMGLSQEQIKSFSDSKKIELLGYTFGEEDIILQRQVAGLANPNLESHCDDDLAVVLDFTFEEDLYKIWISREVVNRVQRLRKEAKLQHDDPVDMWAEEMTPKLDALTKTKMEFIEKLLMRKLRLGGRPEHLVVVANESYEIEGEKLSVVFTLKGPQFLPALDQLAESAPVACALQQFLVAQRLEDLAGSSVTCRLDEKKFVLKKGVHYDL